MGDRGGKIHFRVEFDPKEAALLVLDYKDPELLKRFLTESGSIINRKRSGLTSKQQRNLGRQIKRARQIALLPFTTTL